MSERVWERFLTEQDRAHLLVHGTRRRPLGQRPVLLLIDLYRWVFGDEPQPLLEAIETWPGSCGLAAWEALPHCRRILDEARSAGIPVIHVTGLEGVPRGRWSRPRSPGSDMVAEDVAMADRSRRAYEIVDELAPIEGELVIRKAAPSAFWGTPLVGHLNFLQADTVMVIGESTSGCVRATVVDGNSYRLNVAVVEEGVFDRHEAPHAMALFDMSQKYAALLGVDEAVDYLRRVGAERPTATGEA
jgi:nicotinamidase-related amidase